MANPHTIGRRTKAQLYADLREVFSLYDLEIVMDDGIWLKNVALEDMMCLYIRPFSAHSPLDSNSGAKKGQWGSKGKVKE